MHRIVLCALSDAGMKDGVYMFTMHRNREVSICVVSRKSRPESPVFNTGVSGIKDSSTSSLCTLEVKGPERGRNLSKDSGVHIVRPESPVFNTRVSGV